MGTVINVLLIIVWVLIALVLLLAFKYTEVRKKLIKSEKLGREYYREYKRITEEHKATYNKLVEVIKERNELHLRLIKMLGTRAYKKEILADLRNGLTYKELGEKYGFKPNTINKAVCRWKAKMIAVVDLKKVGRKK